MAILSFFQGQEGLSGVNPPLVYVVTSDSYSTVTTAGYLNPYLGAGGLGFANGQVAFVNYNATPVGSGQYILGNSSMFEVSIANGVGSLVPTANVSAPLIVPGNIQAGLNGTAGMFISFPGTLNKGSLEFYATNNTGNTVTQITNAAFGQATTLTIPDPGAAAASFLLTKSAGTQTIATGNLALTVGNLTLTAGSYTATAGNYIAGNATTPNAGNFQSFPSASGGANDKFVFAAVTSGGNFTSTLSSGTVGQSTTYSLPDPGSATASFILTKSGGTQTISTGNLALTVGNITATAGNIQAGSSGHAGTFTSFPGTAANGSFIFAGVNNSNNFASTLSNSAVAQATLYTLPDPANANGQVLVGATATPFTNNHIVVASGTAGVVTDGGFQIKSVAHAAVAGGAAAQTVTDAFCTTASMVTASWNDTTNPVEIQTVAAGNGSFIVTSTADPGASHLNYIITKV